MQNQTPLTPRERDVYEFISAVVREKGYAPSVRDICTELGLSSTSTVHTYLARLEAKGYIQRDSGKSRAMRVDSGNDISRAPATLRIPLIGKVAAGAPILAIENYEGYIDFPRQSVSTTNTLFALRVQGESMIGAGILDGDIIIVEKREVASDGEIVVAMVDGDATVKTFYRDGNRFRLQPENPDMQPIYAAEVIIIGVVVACMRYYTKPHMLTEQ